MNRDVSGEDHRSNLPGSTSRSDGGNSVVPGDSPSDRGSRVGPPEDEDPGPGVIVKVKSEFVHDSFLQDEGFIVKVKVKSEFIDESTFQDKEVDGKLMVDPGFMHYPLRGIVYPVKVEHFQNDFSQSFLDALSNECIKQEPCDSPPRELKNAPQLFEENQLKMVSCSKSSSQLFDKEVSFNQNMTQTCQQPKSKRVPTKNNNCNTTFKKTERNEKPHNCSVCKKTFGSLASLKRCQAFHNVPSDSP
uniref:uncharacterized protein isoform X2 n=1 Tax=Myxine glutinosa TaxID=7769 RepID=UPI00359024CC